MHNLCACFIDFLILLKIGLELCGLFYEPADVRYLINIGLAKRNARLNLTDFRENYACIE